MTNQPYNPHNPSSVTEMINHLKWPSLQQRRVWADVTLMYKVVNRLIAVPVNYHPTLPLCVQLGEAPAGSSYQFNHGLMLIRICFSQELSPLGTCYRNPALPLRVWMLSNRQSNLFPMCHPMYRRIRPCKVYIHVGC